MEKQILKNCFECPKYITKECKNKFKSSYKSIRSTKRGFQRSLKVIGGDTETFKGNPMSIQLYDPDNQGSIKFVDKDNVMDIFLETLESYHLGHGVMSAVIFFHNLSFDLPILFYPLNDNFIYSQFKKDIPKFNCRIDFKCNKVFFGTITFYSDELNRKGKHKVKRRFYIRDSYAFMHNSLKNLARELKLPDKLEPPKGLGEKLFTKDDEYFVKYAVNDAYTEYFLAQNILDSHKEFNVPLACSTPNLAQKIFTKHFLKDVKDETIWLPNKEVWDASTLSYHGGKNLFTLSKVEKIKGVYELDVNSMYPYAMVNLPKWSKGKFIKVNEFSYEYAGVYCITGKVNQCKYPIIPAHDFKYYGKAEDENIFNVWVASYEILEALNSKELEIIDIWGYIFIPSEDAVNPFIGYVEHFYKLKSELPKDDSRRMMTKLLLNALYGKFLQSICCYGEVDSKSIIKRDANGDIEEVEFIECEKVYRAGGLCNPFIGSLITSFCRAYLHRLEHRYQSIDSSTDSIKTVKEPDPTDMGNEIGQLSMKCYGDTIFFRNKVYVMLDKEDNPVHYALHGFEGTVQELISLYNSKEHEYSYKRMRKLKEAKRSGEQPFEFFETKAVLNVDYGDGLPKDKARAEKEMSKHLQDFIAEVYSDPQTLDNQNIDNSLSVKERNDNFIKGLREHRRI